MTKKKAKLKLTDFFIFAFCLSIGASSIWLFYKDLNNSTSRKDKENIGIISFKDKIAQRKFDDRIVWERIQTGTPLYNFDTIRTSDLASAIITFEDGTVINLNENTMLQVYKSKDGMGISVGDGNITVDTTNAKTSVDVSMKNGSKLVLESGSRLTAKTDSTSENNSFNLQSGKANLVNLQGEEQTVNEGQAVKVDGTGQVKNEVISVNSVSENLHLLSFENEEEEKKVLFEWNVIEELKNEEICIEVSYDKDFSEISQSFTKQGASSVELSGKPGAKLYWRIYPLNDKHNVFTGIIAIDSVEPIKQISPVYDSVIKTNLDLSQINFAWTGNKYASHYKFELCDEVNFENPIISREVSENYTTAAIEKFGTYYWRITPFYSINDLGYDKPTELSKFTIKKNEIVAKPVPLLPREDAIIELDSKGKNVTFLWKSDAENAGYKVIIAADKNFSHPVFEGSSNENKLTQKIDTSILEPENMYFWKVVRIDADNDSSALAQSAEQESAGATITKNTTTVNSGDSESDVRCLVVQEYIPGKNNTVFPPEGYNIEFSKLPNINFTWKLSEMYRNNETLSVFQISDKIDFSSNIQEVKTYATNVSGINLTQGEFFWRVGVIPKDYFEPTAFTNPQSLKILAELGTPQIIHPEPDSIQTIYGNNAVKIEWNEVTGADFYKVQIYNAETGSTVGTVQSVKEPNTIVYLPENSYEDKIPYKCSIQAVSEQTDLTPLRVGKAVETLFYARNPIAVTLESPAENAKIAGLNALRQKTSFIWNIGDKPEKMQFILQKQNSSGVMKTVQSFETSRQNANLQRLTPGYYRWTIKASSKEGIPLDAQTYNTFTILPAEELPKPVITQPQKNVKLDSAYFRKQRYITFAWQKIEGATDYEFTIYQKNANGTLRQIEKKSGLSKPEYKFKDLSLLDNGTFEYHIKAFSHAKDGYEEQHSGTSSGQFKIEIELPKAVKTKDSGIMYGN